MKGLFHPSVRGALVLGFGLAVYLAAWTALAYDAGHRGPAGLDFERRGPQAVIAVSMLDAAAALLVVPLAALGGRRRDSLVAMGVAFAATTAGVLLLDARSTRVATMDVVGTRVLLAAIAALAAGLSRLAARATRDVYDAAATVYVALLALVGAVVFAAPLLARSAGVERLIAGLLIANPLVAMASATNFDVMRTEVLYRITPVGQRLFDYPSWQSASMLYTAAAVICVAGSSLIRSREA